MGSLTEENYIKSIYTLSQAKGEVFVSELAQKLDVKLPTVNSMVKKLAAKTIVAYAPYKGIKLTEKGKKEALGIIRKHRLADIQFFSRVITLEQSRIVRQMMDPCRRLNLTGHGLRRLCSTTSPVRTPKQATPLLGSPK